MSFCHALAHRKLRFVFPRGVVSGTAPSLVWISFEWTMAFNFHGHLGTGFRYGCSSCFAGSQLFRGAALRKVKGIQFVLLPDGSSWKPLDQEMGVKSAPGITNEHTYSHR